MTDKRSPGDFRLAVARYRVDRLAHVNGDERDGGVEDAADAATQSARDPTLEQRAQYVRVAIEQAERRGDFDELSGTGKSLANLHQSYDPDWWFRRKIEREKLTGLAPPALSLRTENAGLDSRLAAAPSERAVRELLDDFNRRVVEARRQLQGGPPVVTPTRDVDAEVEKWRGRRAARDRAAEQERERAAAARAAMSWRERRRARRVERHGPCGP